jgi:2-oxoglutarate ferredoxin oxidoreductase subunit beta
MSSQGGSEPPATAAYHAHIANDWCAGCGDFGILRALETALAQSGVAPERVAVFGGIGCSGKTPYYLNAYSVHTLHGRVLPFAFGAKLANPQLTVVAVGGDGDGLSIGAGHFVNAGRRNLDLTYVLFNNGVYGLTKGQASPTLPRGEQIGTMARPNPMHEVNAITLAIAAGFTWVGRGYAYDVRQLTALLVQAIAHPGLAYLDVLQPCPTYNDLHTKQWLVPRLYSLQDEGYDAVVEAGSSEGAAHRRREACMRRAGEWGERIATGVFLQDLSRARFDEDLLRLQPRYAQYPPARLGVADGQGRPTADLAALFESLRVGRG